MKPQRLDKIIATYSSYSRSEVAKLIKAKLVTVNGNLVTNASNKFITSDQIAINGELLEVIHDKNFIVFNKPKGYVCANEDSINPTIFDLLPMYMKTMHTVGRLDLDTSGLLFLTNDGLISHKLTSPKHHVKKVYRVWLEDPITDNYQQKFTQGILLNGEKEPTLPAKLDILDEYTCDVTIYEGRYHQIKRMFAALNNKVIDLHRYQIGNYRLPDTLSESEYLEFEANEILKMIYTSN